MNDTLDTPATRSRRRRTVAATVAGNFVEYFDWLAFGLFAPLLAAQFFPSSDPVASLLGTFAVFAGGMLFRPIGGVLMGRLADRRGRKPAMVVSILLMAGGSLLIGVSPTAAQVGILAPILLLVGRAAQGVSAGGEWPTAVTYLMELAPKGRRCLYGSLFAMTAAAGAFAASALGGGLTSLLGAAAMAEWGWRVPFLLGAVLGVGLLLLRSRVAESEVFERSVRSSRRRGSLRALLGAHWRSVLLVVVFVAGTTMVTGTWTTVVPATGQRLNGPEITFWVVACVTVLVTAVQVPIGMLADRVGVRPMLAVFGIGFAVAGPFAYLGVTAGFWSLFVCYGVGILFTACLTAVMPTVLAALYPADVRALGIGLPHSVTTAIFGGLTPWLATWMATRGLSAWYIAGVSVTVLIAWAAAAAGVRRAARSSSTADDDEHDSPGVEPAYATAA